MMLVPPGATLTMVAALSDPRLNIACATPLKMRGNKSAPSTPMTVNAHSHSCGADHG